VPIGSLESDMEFVRNWNEQETDVIRFKVGRTPPAPSLDQEWLALESALPSEVPNSPIQGGEAWPWARLAHFPNGEMEGGIAPDDHCDNVSANVSMETEIVGVS
jgi:hypothetical protein